MSTLTIILTTLLAAGGIDPDAPAPPGGIDLAELDAAFAGTEPVHEISAPAPPPEARIDALGVPVVNRLDEDGTYATWTLILRHENGRVTLAYESGGNLDLLRRAHAAVEQARLTRRRVTVRGLNGPEDVLLMDRLTVAAAGRPALTLDTDAGDPLEDAILEAEAAEAATPPIDLDPVRTTRADLDRRDGVMVKIEGVPEANAFKHGNGQGVWNVLVRLDGGVLLAYESGENIDRLSRLAAVVDLAVQERRPMAFVGRYDKGMQVVLLSAIEPAPGLQLLTDIGEAGFGLVRGPGGGPVIERSVEPLLQPAYRDPVYLTPEPTPLFEEEYLTPTYVETPIPVLIERQVIVERVHCWVLPEIVLAQRTRHRDRPTWLARWRSWSFCPRHHFDQRWGRWHVRRHPAYFNFRIAFSWHGRSDDDERRTHRSRDDGRGRGAEHTYSASSHRADVRRRSDALSTARREARDGSHRSRGDRESSTRRTVVEARRPARRTITTTPVTVRSGERSESRRRGFSASAPVTRVTPSRETTRSFADRTRDDALERHRQRLAEIRSRQEDARRAAEQRLRDAARRSAEAASRKRIEVRRPARRTVTVAPSTTPSRRATRTTSSAVPDRRTSNTSLSERLRAAAQRPARAAETKRIEVRRPARRTVTVAPSTTPSRRTTRTTSSAGRDRRTSSTSRSDRSTSRVSASRATSSRTSSRATRATVAGRSKTRTRGRSDRATARSSKSRSTRRETVKGRDRRR